MVYGQHMSVICNLALYALALFTLNVFVPEALSPHTMQYSIGWARLMSAPLPRSLSTDTASVTNYQKRQTLITWHSG